VEIIDKIEFEPPGGILGFMITADKIHESLEAGFYHRHQQLKKLLESAG
jgi:ligand-binding SRPBCC domain-containing protein